MHLFRSPTFGLPLHFTENTLVSGHLMPKHIVDLNDYQPSEWPTTPEGEERQAQELESMVRLLFASSKVEAFTSWDFTDEYMEMKQGRFLIPKGGMRNRPCFTDYDLS